MNDDSRRINVDEVIEFIQAQSPESKVYLGVDSIKFKKHGKWLADYTLVVVVHIDSAHGCKIFGEVQREPVYDQRKDRPNLRLMTEIYKVSELYLKLAPALVNREVEIHLDINPDPRFASSNVVQQGIGYIRATCGLEPKIKPQAFAASYAADRLTDLTPLIPVTNG